MFNIFKKTTSSPYPYNINVPFEMAFKALKEGYTIKHGNMSNCYLYMINNRVIEVIDRDDKHNCFEIDEFSLFDMLKDTWQIIEPLKNTKMKGDE